MAGIFTDDAAGLNDPTAKIDEGTSKTPENIAKAAGGYQKTNGLSLIGLMGKNNVKYSPGFTPDELYAVEDKGTAPNGWYGHLLKGHMSNKDNNLTDIDTSRRFDAQIDDNIMPISIRDYLLKFNDTSSDYLRHNFQIDGRRPIPDSNGNATPGQKSTPFENNDPVMFGFEVIVDAVSSPLLNGSVEDFITQFSNISEIQSRMPVIMEFKKQFAKLFKIKGSIRSTTTGTNTFANITGVPEKLENIANSSSQKDMYQVGRKTYLSYYIQKITGLSKLAEANTSEAKKYLVDYRKDLITLSFLEDVSTTMGTLSHLYKLLYWSKPNGKGLIPENLLRFNCEIVVSECRNFNRVREAANNNEIEIIKDNVSRYIYSLRECQFFFDKMPHDDTIDMSSIQSYGDSAAKFDVSFDYKYTTLNFERWTASADRFGQYVGYNGGSIWRKDSTTGTEKPRFYSLGENKLSQNGVDKVDMFWYGSSANQEEIDKKVGNESQVPEDTTIENANYNVSNTPGKSKSTSTLESFKKNSKEVAKKAAQNAANFVVKEVNNQINMRVALLNGTISKIKNALGLAGLKTEPRNVYPKPYAPHSFGIFFDVRNDLFNFLGEDLASIMQNGANIINPAKDPSNPRKNPFKSALRQGQGIYKNNANYTANTLGSIAKRFGRK